MEKIHFRATQVIIDIRSSKGHLYLYILDMHILDGPRLFSSTVPQPYKNGISCILRNNIGNFYILNIKDNELANFSILNSSFTRLNTHGNGRPKGIKDLDVLYGDVLESTM